MKKVLGLIMLGLLALLFWATVGAATEHIYVRQKVNDFIEKGVLQEELSTTEKRIFFVSSDFKLDDKTYQKVGNNLLPYGPGDILATTRGGFNSEIVRGTVEFYVGGHAGLLCGNYYDSNYHITTSNTIETTGFDATTVAKVYSISTWNNSSYEETFAFRVNTSKENRFKAFLEGVSLLGQPYNFSFVFGIERRKYCSDIVSASYRTLGIDLNYDGLATTVLDLMVSNQIYMTYYSYYNNETETKDTYILVDGGEDSELSSTL